MGDSKKVDVLMFEALKNAVAGSAAAFRLTLKLEAVSPKVFPPTYEGGKYATEDRIINGQRLPCVLLDSVPSQANRMELALQDAVDGGLIELPLVTSNFSKSKETEKNPHLKRFNITSLQAPHRIADAILRDSSLVEDGKKPVKFKDTEIGKALDDEVDFSFATPLLKFAPHCLVFGMWHSTGDKRRAMGVKFARALVSEIVGVNAIPGVTTSSRLDPLGIQKLIDKEDEQGVKIYRAKGGGWTLEKEEAEQKDNKPVLYGKKGKPSEINHGNVTPDIVYRKDKTGNLILGDTERPVMMVVFDNEQERGNKYVIRDERKPIAKGGFTIDYAEQTTVLSLPALRRLRFPAKPGEKSSPESDTAARTYLASLGLLGATLAVDAGYDLRSRCILRATNAVQWHLLGKPGDEDVTFVLDKEAAIKLYRAALDGVQKAKLPIHLEEIILTPTDDLVTLVKRSMELTAAETGEVN
jgi:CRISPR-associated protein Csb1